jgi:hypothetical protein
MVVLHLQGATVQPEDVQRTATPVVYRTVGGREAAIVHMPQNRAADGRPFDNSSCLRSFLYADRS